MNDKELIEVADIGFAVNNAVDDLKEIADYITKEDYENGVIEILKKFM
ncbi:cof family hydrolase [[Clostridium] sordellii]|nr:cof family hydrolase [[Clostridium] sordellii] [Paeniclostridium sordellii]